MNASATAALGLGLLRAALEASVADAAEAEVEVAETTAAAEHAEVEVEAEATAEPEAVAHDEVQAEVGVVAEATAAIEPAADVGGPSAEEELGDALRKRSETGSTDSGGRSSAGSGDSEPGSREASPTAAGSAAAAPTEEPEDEEEGDENMVLAPTLESEQERILAEFLVGSGGKNRAYLERLARSAAEASLKGYGIQRSTRVVRRTRTHKTIQRKDSRTNTVDHKTEETEKIEEWVEEGPAELAGVSMLCARQRVCSEEAQDGERTVVSSECQGKVGFWLGGPTAATSAHKSFNFAYSGSSMPSTQELLRQATLAS